MVMKIPYFHGISIYPELVSIQLTLNYIHAELRSAYPGLNSAYPQFNVAGSKTNFGINEISSDDDEYKDEDEDVDVYHNRIDIFLLNRMEYRKFEAACKLENNRRQLGLLTEAQTPRKTRARCRQCKLDDGSSAYQLQVGDWAT